MLTLSTNTIKSTLATAAVVVAGALALPAMASADPSATGCSPLDNPNGYCEFVGGTGADAANDVGGRTQFEINTAGPGSGGGPIVACDDSRATAVTDGSEVVTTTLTFDDCLAFGFVPAVVTCQSMDITIDDVPATGDAHGFLGLGFEDCEIDVLEGACVINTSDEDPDGQAVTLEATGADAFGTGALLTVPVEDNTDALTFNAAGPACEGVGVPETGDATFSDSPNTGEILYEEVGSDLVIEDVP